MHYRNKRESEAEMRKLRKAYYDYYEYSYRKDYEYEPIPEEFVGTYVFLTLIPSLHNSMPGLKEVIELLSEKIFFKTENKKDRTFTLDKFSLRRSHCASTYRGEDIEDRLFEKRENVKWYVLNPMYWGQDYPYRITANSLNYFNKDKYSPCDIEKRSAVLKKEGIKLKTTISTIIYESLSEDAKKYFAKLESSYYGRTVTNYTLIRPIPETYTKLGYNYLIYRYRKIIDGTKDSESDWFSNHYIYGNYNKFCHWNNKRNCNWWNREWDWDEKRRKIKSKILQQEIEDGNNYLTNSDNFDII